MSNPTRQTLAAIREAKSRVNDILSQLVHLNDKLESMSIGESTDADIAKLLADNVLERAGEIRASVFEASRNYERVFRLIDGYRWMNGKWETGLISEEQARAIAETTSVDALEAIAKDVGIAS